MPDNDYRPDEESQELGRNLASLTVKDFHGPPREESRETVSLEMHARQLGVEAPLHDVTFVMQEFAWQWELARNFDGRMPCVRIGDDEQGETVPMSLPFDWPFPRPFRSWRWIRRHFPFPPEFLFEEYRDYLRAYGKNEGISMESADNVLERLQNGLGDFLAYRIAGSGGGRRRSGGPPPPSSWSPGGGLSVEMWCNTSGLTIEFSHAYFIHFLNFGSPSFPVKNSLLAGRYVFQGKGPTYPSGTPRSQVFRIPPDYKAVTTYF
ncbi:MAG: hypothetical protein M9920_04640 [Verrucomicrobiae bacterium]|nr:hypothetical protein [Verrucomicrobiae bacterium]